MSRVFGILAIVVCVWIGMEIYTQGIANAFDGRLAWMGEPLDANRSDPRYEGRSITQRVEQRVTADIYEGFERREAGIEASD